MASSCSLRFFGPGLNNVIFKKCTYSDLFLVKDYLTTCCFQWFSESLRE